MLKTKPNAISHAPRASSLRGYQDASMADQVGTALAEIGALDSCRSATSIVLKPNWVSHSNPLGHDTSSLVTHPVVIEAVAATVADVLPSGARIIIGDAPVQGCDFDELLRVNRIPEMVARLSTRFPRVSFAVQDWRLVRAASRFSLHATERVDDFDPALHEIIDLGPRSFLDQVSDKADRFRVTCYPHSSMKKRHAPGKHEYLVSRAALDADVFINLPKLKTHIKAGITGALKNLVGINGHKEFLPHHVIGSPGTGGDSHREDSRIRDLFERYYDFHFEHLANLPRPFISVLSRALNSADRLTARLVDPSNFGSWPGNDTVWRMTLDLNHLLYAWAPRRPRAVFTLVDAITVGTGDGPLRPIPAHLGVLLAGRNPATLDAVGAQLLGFDPLALPTIREALQNPASIFRAPLPEPELAPAPHIRRPTNWEHVAGPPRR
ncbi:MAG: DUF362 domain-containing protein [Myxococcota bacterium]